MLLLNSFVKSFIALLKDSSEASITASLQILFGSATLTIIRERGLGSYFTTSRCFEFGVRLFELSLFVKESFEVG